MTELLLEGRVSWRSERSGRDGTLSIGPANVSRVIGLRRLLALLRFAAAATVVVTVVAVVVGAVAAGLGVRWAERRREQGLDDPVTVVRQRVHEAREWIDARRSPHDNAPGSDL